MTPVAASAMYATAPWGVTDQAEFRNSVLIVDTTLSPLELLHTGQTLEQDARRVRERHWGPRTLDIDLVHIEGETSDTRRLWLPHPWADRSGRSSWCRGLDADPHAALSGRAVTEWLAELGPDAATAGIRARPEVEWAP